MKHGGTTPPFRGPSGEVLAGSIAEVRYLRLGGVDQWVLLRGACVDNPPLILLQGGPGLSETFFFRHFNAPLEGAFTVVYWDQRGSGKSFDRRIPKSSMTIQQFLADLDELVETVRERVGQRKIVLFGHSWGSALGVLYAARFPEKVAVYVGSAQIGDWPAAEAASYAFALGTAQRLHHRKALKALHAIGWPPYPVESLWKERFWLNRLDGQVNVRTMWRLTRAFLSVPELSLRDFPNLMRGFRFTLDTMWDEVSRVNLVKLAPALEMPVFFLLGRQDHWVPPESSVAYFDALTAPEKRLVWFEASGHEPFVDQARDFNATMENVVRPAAFSHRRAEPGTAGLSSV
jgi:pimeloyl-ACP methyl ester carboxylesterase